MRFIKKASSSNISELSSVYKEFELYINRDDFSTQEKIKENIRIITQVHKEQNAIVTVIHCPSSKYLTSIDKDEPYINYMSWCEVVGDNDEMELFISICNFADDIAKVYNLSDSVNSKVKESGVEDNDDNDDAEENQIQNSEDKAKIQVILHTGCVIGCDEHPKFKCQFNVSDSKTCFKNFGIFDISEFYNGIQKFENIKIGFENITPFSHANGTIGSNSGYGYENFTLAKNLNETYKTGMFGAVVDFCHIIATCKLLGISTERIKYLENYMNGISEEQRKLICLFHLSKYEETNNTHGGIFTDSEEDQIIITNIRDWCLEKSRNTPITLEVIESQDVIKGSYNFFKIMLEWSKLHILIKNKVGDDLYDFFENLYKFYSLQFNRKTNTNVQLNN